MEEIAIQITNLKKQYKLGAIGGGTLTADLQSWWARKRGKADPNVQLGIDAEQFGKRFWALDGIDLSIRKGEAVGIIGANGAGKSTLLKILSRVTAPTEGEVKIKGRISSMLEVGTGFHGELTGRENIYMNGAILGMNKKEIEAKIEDIIEFSECREFIDTPVKRYSSGMYVKLAFAVAAHLDADILVMDEVLAVGDMKFQEKCLGKMGDASASEGKTVLYVSHNMNTIRQLCTRCIVLERGKIIYDGETEQAIAIYMDRNTGDLRTRYDLSHAERPLLQPGKSVRLHSFEFLDKEHAVFDRKEKIRFKIEWSATENIPGLRIYFLIRFADSSVVGMTESEAFGDAEAGVRKTSYFEFDPAEFADGRYYFFADVFSMNESRAHLSYDHPYEKIYFEISSSNETGLVWQSKYWGHVRLNPIVCVGKN